MGERNYVIYDVFTRERLAGNPLAIVLDADGLDDGAMQAIAAEFNLSETVFVSPPARPGHAAALRIFTPKYELPFAGHPTVGTAIALAERNGDGVGNDAASLLVLEEKIGDVRCVVSHEDGVAFAEFDLPQLSQSLEYVPDNEAIAAAIGLGPHEIGFENHRPSLWSAGVPYLTVPVSGIEAMARVRFDGQAWLDLAPRRADGNPACAYLYCRETLHHTSAFHARMFVPGPPTYEDPATGSAAAAFSGAIAFFDEPRDGAHQCWIEQGIEMGRPSHIRLELDIRQLAVSAARIGGNAVKVAAGALLS
ncbi:PhzF family phenazine biosynthesis protein [Mesorhizobium sp. CAU 1732]|uniref:PhzF family phenazine biosynthesis protein n=1 Tax=Mesorhizobium sp. CAU 1732 TaxID=3140358 RepID=UPI0032619CC0